MAIDRSGQLPEPKEIVTLAHADMVRQLIDLESFVTMSYARFDLGRQSPRSRRLRAHGDDGRARARPARARSCTAATFRSGFARERSSTRSAVSFETGDLFLFYSDGITEIRNPAGELYGADRLAECVRTNRDREPEALVEAIRSAAMAFAESDRLADDLTCVALRVGDAPRPLARSEFEISSDLKDLARARAFVRDFCRGVPGGLIGEDDVSDLELAVNEAASNIMKHAYHGRADQRIHLEADVLSGPRVDPASSPRRRVRPGRGLAARAGWLA